MYTIRPIVLDSDEPDYQAISDQAYFATLRELGLPFDTKLHSRNDKGPFVNHVGKVWQRHFTAAFRNH